MSCELYRHFDANGTLLYVGISLSAVSRLNQHKRSEWFPRIARVEIERCETREYAAYLEWLAYEKEKPLFNAVKPACDPNSPSLVYFLIQGARAEVWEKAWDPTCDIGDIHEVCDEMEAELLPKWYRPNPIHTKPTQPIGSPNLKRGRPKKGEKRAKPWEAAGISKASWYRQKKAPK